MGRFDKVSDAKYYDGGVYIEPGVYVSDDGALEILAIKQGTSRLGKDYLVAELKIHASDNPKRPPGSECSWMVTMDNDAAPGNVKRFGAVVMSALAGAPVGDDQVDGPGIDGLASPQNPAKGVRLNAQAALVKTRAGNDFTKVVWQVPPKALRRKSA